ncbi:hypothetical protein LUZ61_006518 [Rhynchospora tenuis]|uniref:Nodulin-related protein 1 n=1 Tax=Rhynchospora tenuis TaxID=198213 RepID=A0AAD5ZRW9_9POAL|nr:hypothetical protein LUZ61_006518 [Rhynchospora tenuis]
MDPNTKTEKNESNTSPTELFSSAQILGQTAMSAFHNESDKVDKAKAAGAAEDLLGAASQYGKLDNTSYGKYVDKAEEYLHQYSEPGAAKDTAKAEEKTAAPAPKEGGAEEPEKTTTEPPKDGGSEQIEKKEESGGGLESYVKMAEGFVNKKEGDSAGGESGGALGGALKMAGGLFK